MLMLHFMNVGTRGVRPGAASRTPTSGTARFSNPLGVYDFQKRSSIIEVSEQGPQTLGRRASVLAHGEGLQAHAWAVEVRLKGYRA